MEWKNKKVIKVQIIQYFNFHTFCWFIFNTLINLDRVSPIFKKRLTVSALISLNVTPVTCSEA